MHAWHCRPQNLEYLTIFFLLVKTKATLLFGCKLIQYWLYEVCHYLDQISYSYQLSVRGRFQGPGATKWWEIPRAGSKKHFVSVGWYVHMGYKAQRGGILYSHWSNQSSGQCIWVLLYRTTFERQVPSQHQDKARYIMPLSAIRNAHELVSLHELDKDSLQ